MTIFYAAGLVEQLRRAAARSRRDDLRTTFAIRNLRCRGDRRREPPTSIVEKPRPAIELCRNGLYFFDHAPAIARALQPARGEYEITDLNAEYCGAALHVELRARRGVADMGTHESLHAASSFIRQSRRQGLKIASPEVAPEWVDHTRRILPSCRRPGRYTYGQELMDLRMEHAVKITH